MTRAQTALALAAFVILGCGGAPRQERVARAEPPQASAPTEDESPEDSVELGHSGEPEDEETEANLEVLEVLEGRASYYSDRLAGRSTASGEPYRPEALTAASRELPFHSLVRVTRLTGEGAPMGSVTVRVNDRGPFGDHSRILDLSRAAAEELDMIRAGVVSVRVEILRRGR